MPNLLLTDKCNRACTYCFAKEKLKTSHAKELSFEDLRYVVDFIERSGSRDLNILGGEPSLHPQFLSFMKYLLARDFNLTIFSNGMFSETLSDQFSAVMETTKSGKVRIVVNINEQKYRTAHEDALQAFLFKKLKRHVSLSFNIFTDDFEPGFLADTIVANRLVPEIRLGLASPIYNHGNSFARVDYYEKIYRSILLLSEQAAQHDIRMNFDCGFPLCTVPDEMLGRLYKNNVHVSFRCGVPVDIGPDLKVWRCFPLSSVFNRHLKDFDTVDAMYRYYEDVFAAGRNHGIYDRCSTCRHKKNRLCEGGCMSHYLHKFLPEAATETVQS